MLKRYWKNKQGQGMSEYLILVMLIAIASIAATQTVGSAVKNRLNIVHQKIQGLEFGE